MTIAETLLLDYDAEIQNTRRILERIPEDKPDWKPHHKSMPMGRLATHVAACPCSAAPSSPPTSSTWRLPSFPRWYLSRAKNSSPNSKKPAQPPARPSSPQPTNTAQALEAPLRRPSLRRRTPSRPLSHHVPQPPRPPPRPAQRLPPPQRSPRPRTLRPIRRRTV